MREKNKHIRIVLAVIFALIISVSFSACSENGTVSYDNNNTDSGIVSLETIIDEVMEYAASNNKVISENAEAAITEMYNEGNYDSFSIYNSLCESGIFTDEEITDWYQAEYTTDIKSYDGYTAEGKMKIGSWIKASDTVTVNKIWKAAGGEGEAPDLTTFNYYSNDANIFRNDKAAIAFATIEYTNTTNGYDFTEEYPFQISDRIYCSSQMSTLYHNTIVYFSNSTKKNEESFNITMKSNHWGPVVVAIAASNVFGPNFDENGNEDLEDLKICFGLNTFTIPISWKEGAKKVTLADLEVKTYVLSVDTGDWYKTNGYISDDGWKCGSEGKESYVLWRNGSTTQWMNGGVYDKAGNSKFNAKLNKQYNVFEGDILTTAESKSETGTTVIKIYGDSKLLYESQEISAKTETIHFKVDVTNVHNLEVESVTDENNIGPSVAIINNLIYKN